MAKRVIQECDLTKQEYDPDETVTIVIKKGGKKTGRTYELSAEAASRLEQQLVSDNKLGVDWWFAPGREVAKQEQPKTGRTLADLEIEDDEKYVASKQAELREAGVIQETREEPEESIVGEALGAPKINNGCRHLNKGRTQTTLKGKKRFAYRICQECREKIPEQTVEERKAYMSGKTDLDIRVRDLNE